MIFIWSSKAEIGDLEYAFVIDEEVGGLHVSMQDLVRVQIPKPFQQLQHVAFNLRLRERDRGVFEKP